MSMSSPSPPTPTDPKITAENQQQINRQSGIETQAGSNVNQVTPYGSLTYNQSGTGPGGIPLYTATTSLSPDQEQLLNLLQGNQLTAGTQAGKLLTGAGYGDKNPADVIGGSTSGTTADLMGKYTDYLTPYFTKQTQELDTQLKNQGFKPGDPAYDSAMLGNSNRQNNAITGFLAQVEPAAYSQAVSSYLLPLQTATTEMGLSQPGSLPGSLVPTPGFSEQPANLIAATASAQDAQMKAYEAQQKSHDAMMTGLFNIGSTVLGGWAKGGFAAPGFLA